MVRLDRNRSRREEHDESDACVRVVETRSRRLSKRPGHGSRMKEVIVMIVVVRKEHAKSSRTADPDLCFRQPHPNKTARSECC